MTFSATSGGNRELIKINDGSIMGVEFYSDPSVQDVLEYRFDFDVPVHCTQTTSCGDNPMTMENDIVKVHVHTTIEHDIAMVYKGIDTNLQNKANA
jgi:hypothetical protein